MCSIFIEGYNCVIMLFIDTSFLQWDTNVYIVYCMSTASKPISPFSRGSSSPPIKSCSFFQAGPLDLNFPLLCCLYCNLPIHFPILWPCIPCYSFSEQLLQKCMFLVCFILFLTYWTEHPKAQANQLRQSQSQRSNYLQWSVWRQLTYQTFSTILESHIAILKSVWS